MAFRSNHLVLSFLPSLLPITYISKVCGIGIFILAPQQVHQCEKAGTFEWPIFYCSCLSWPVATWLLFEFSWIRLHNPDIYLNHLSKFDTMLSFNILYYSCWKYILSTKKIVKQKKVLILFSRQFVYLN